MLALAVGAARSHAQAERRTTALALGEFDYAENDGFGELFTDSVSSWHLMVGYLFMEHLAVEGGYGKTGTIRDTDVPRALPGSARIDLTVTRVSGS